MSGIEWLILLVTEFRSALRYLGSIAAIICCSSAHSTPKYSWNMQRASACASRCCAIWYWVLVPLMTNLPGFCGLMYGVFPGTNVAYGSGEHTRHKCPCSPPQSVECIAWAFSFTSFCRVIRVVVEDSPMIRVKSGYLRMLFL